MHYRDDLRKIGDAAKAKVFNTCGAADVIVSTDPLHVGYLGGYRSILLDADRNYRCGIVATRERTCLITGASDAAPALEVFRDPADIYRYGEFFVSSSGAAASYSSMPKPSVDFAGALRSAVMAMIRPGQVLGLDAGDVPEGSLGHLMEGRRWVNVRPHVLAARRIKSDAEILKLHAISQITERGMMSALQQAREGVSELELSRIISSEIIVNGGIPRFVVVTSGERSALVDAYATPAKLKKGALLRLDIGCTLDGYWADTARTAVIGEPTVQQQRRYDALLDGITAQTQALKAGVSAAELFHAAVDRVRRGALPDYQRNHCGHGLGINAHEFPTLNAINKDVEIVEGMVINLETPYYEIGWGGMMVEDTVVVRTSGVEYLTIADRTLRAL